MDKMERLASEWLAMMNEIERLASEWLAIKAEEDKARDKRIEIEKDMLALHPAREEGSETITTPLGVKIKLTGKLTYKANVEQLQALTTAWPEALRPIKTEIKADESALKILRSERPDLWRQIAPAVETKAAKVGVAVTMPEVN